MLEWYIALRRENKQTRLPVKRTSSYLHTIASETTSPWSESTNISVSLIGYMSVIDSTSRLEYDIIRREYFYSLFRPSLQSRYRLFFGPLLAPCVDLCPTLRTHSGQSEVYVCRCACAWDVFACRHVLADKRIVPSLRLNPPTHTPIGS